MLKDKLLIIKIFVLSTCSVSFSAFASNVIMETPLGNIEIELFDDAALEPVGSMTIQFSDCTNAQLSFDFDASDDNDSSVAITRLSPDVFCQAIIDAAL